MDSAEEESLKDKFGPFCFFNEPAADFTTYRAGGRAAALVKPGNTRELLWLWRWCLGKKLPFRILGRGSNVLVSDKGLPGVTAPTGRLACLELSGNAVKAGAGVLWDDLARACAEKGLGGCEKSSGIPGTVGGAVRMNAGAYGQETFDRLISVEAMNAEGRVLTLKKDQIAHGYRVVPGLENLIIISASFEFEPGLAAELLAERARVLAKRAEKQPLDYPSAGSVFKRPVGDYASRIIDACGLKGLKIGGAQVSPKHAGFIINSGGAAAADIYRLIRKVQAEVKVKTGVELELEQALLGEFD
ncbi:MAG: UDP-N-acetylenolpyruvoylglucosamine reductase [Elusimicrobia bacterium GWC2_51_8]|nr:MAG: UDP-N-acetylenolpyruvoylglucosamine reductase [Elusimicrobia bacterium GWC2_51_8]